MTNGLRCRGAGAHKANQTSCEPWSVRAGHALATTLLMALAVLLLPAATSQAAGPGGIGLSAQDMAMAEAAIAENTLTLRLPGMGTSVDGPGPLTQADRLVLLALKFDLLHKGLVPFGEMKTRLEQGESRPMYREVGERFWAWYREVAEKGQSAQLGSFKDRFGTYLAMKNTARRKATIRRLEGHVQAEAAWRRAMESDHRFRSGIAARADQAAATRAAYLHEWHLQGEKDAAAAQAAWAAAMMVFPWRSQ